MDTTRYKNVLEEEKLRLEAGLSTVAVKNPAVPGDWQPIASVVGEEADPIDQADTIRSFEENEGVERDLEARYDEVLAALKRIEDGTYGACMVGGETIEEDRLAADPAATTCKTHLSL